MPSRIGGQIKNSIKLAATESLNWNSFNWESQDYKNIYYTDQERKWEEMKKKKECPEVSSWLENFSVRACLSLEN
jgi:hypothetical protein